MKWFLDTEFNEDGRTIELISIGLVSSAGDSYYAVSGEFDESACNDWVKAHVLPSLVPQSKRKPRWVIASEIRRRVLDAGKPEFWAYFADYDWVALCQLYGRMVDLPEGFPFYCNDIKQLMHEHQIKKHQLPFQDPSSEHNALADAEWNRSAYTAIRRIISTRKS